MLKAAVSLEALGRYDEAIDALAQGMSRHPGIPELPWYAAYLSSQAGRHQTAVYWAKLATIHGCYVGSCSERIGQQYPFARFEGPYDVLRFSLRALGASQDAVAAGLDLVKASSNRKKLSGHSVNGAFNSTEQVITPAFINELSNGQRRPRIGAGFTTAKRPELFMRTYFSFRCALLVGGLLQVDTFTAGRYSPLIEGCTDIWCMY